MFQVFNGNILLQIGSCLLLFVFSLPVFALGADRQAVVHIVADSSIYNYKSGVNLFEGNVKIDQGTTHITADKVVTKDNPQHKMQEAIAYGIKQLAHYWTLPKLNEPEIHAKAKVIKFYPIETNIVLEQNVILTQGENSFHGELILYNKNNQTIIVPAAKNGRAVLVYNPSK
ncbi:MAG: lipopolysaccharide transport periplasmic protein LptA [Gammaproteobacteria bacterium RIFCSPHIGHO2_12_FULL_37_14]|nr:MAG: lipopolysaccharide transport periplasmic protein LptA [Gammaproteobacteria bacterium RIFCSPHIGHO2_12_FULL_37_14]